MDDYRRTRKIEARHKFWSTLDTQRAVYALEELVNDDYVKSLRLVNPVTGTNFPFSFYLGFRGLESIDNYVDSIIRKSEPAGKSYRGQLQLSLYSNNGSIIFEVEDNGVGLSPASRQYIGESEIRSDKLTRPIEGVNGGQGIFLKIAREEVEKLGGSCGYRSSNSGGVIFWWSVPVIMPNQHPS